MALNSNKNNIETPSTESAAIKANPVEVQPPANMKSESHPTSYASIHGPSKPRTREELSLEQIMEIEKKKYECKMRRLNKIITMQNDEISDLKDQLISIQRRLILKIGIFFFFLNDSVIPTPF